MAISRRPHRAGEWRSLGAGRRDRRGRGAEGVRRRRRRVLPRPFAGQQRLRGARPARGVGRRRAAERAGLRQLVYLGGLGDQSPELSRHLRSRAETAKLLASGSVPVTTLRAAMVIGAGSAAFETIVALVDRLPGMICPRWVSTPTQPIALADVAAYLAAAAGHDQMLGESFDAGGPDVMTYREMIERIAAIRGKRPLIVEVPVTHPAPLVVLAQPRDAGPSERRAPADRGAAQRDGRRGRPHSPARPVAL